MDYTPRGRRRDKKDKGAEGLTGGELINPLKPLASLRGTRDDNPRERRLAKLRNVDACVVEMGEGEGAVVCDAPRVLWPTRRCRGRRRAGGLRTSCAPCGRRAYGV